MNQTRQNEDVKNQNLHTNEVLRQLTSKVYTMATHNKMLETQISQVGQQQASTSALTGTFQGQPKLNPKEQINVVRHQRDKKMEPTNKKNDEQKAEKVTKDHM